jgi:hypothetical protein
VHDLAMGRRVLVREMQGWGMGDKEIDAFELVL